jgi:hypothetical protein
MDLYAAQRTNFKPTMPRIALVPGQQRQTTPRSTNRGKANPAKDALMKFAMFNKGA